MPQAQRVRCDGQKCKAHSESIEMNEARQSGGLLPGTSSLANESSESRVMTAVDVLLLAIVDRSSP